MTRFILKLFLIFSTCTISSAQDIITFTSGENLEVKVTIVTNDSISYVPFTNLNGPEINILKSNVITVLYEDGRREVFNNSIKSEEQIPLDSLKPSLATQGVRDATIYYKQHAAAATATLLTSLLSPLLGLIPAISCSAVEPDDNHLGYPDQELMNLYDYNRAYTRKAKKIKQGKVWKSWGVGFGVNLAAVFLIYSVY